MRVRSIDQLTSLWYLSLSFTFLGFATCNFKFGLKVSQKTPLRVYCDNKAASSIAHNPVLHDRTKYIEIDEHIIKEKLETGAICIPYLPSTEQIVDVLTKGLPKVQFDRMVSKLAMEDISKPA